MAIGPSTRIYIYCISWSWTSSFLRLWLLSSYPTHTPPPLSSPHPWPYPDTSSPPPRALFISVVLSSSLWRFKRCASPSLLRLLLHFSVTGLSFSSAPSRESEISLSLSLTPWFARKQSPRRERAPRRRPSCIPEPPHCSFLEGKRENISARDDAGMREDRVPRWEDNGQGDGDEEPGRYGGPR